MNSLELKMFYKYDESRQAGGRAGRQQVRFQEAGRVKIVHAVFRCCCIQAFLQIPLIGKTSFTATALKYFLQFSHLESHLLDVFFVVTAHRGINNTNRWIFAIRTILNYP